MITATTAAPPPNPLGVPEAGRSPGRSQTALRGGRKSRWHADQQRDGLCSPSTMGTLAPPSSALRGSLSAGVSPNPSPVAVPLLANADPELLSTLPCHPTRRLPHQAVLCPPPQESKCSAFPAKTGQRHTVARTRALAVKQGGALSRSRVSEGYPAPQAPGFSQPGRLVWIRKVLVAERTRTKAR